MRSYNSFKVLSQKSKFNFTLLTLKTKRFSKKTVGIKVRVKLRIRV